MSNDEPRRLRGPMKPIEARVLLDEKALHVALSSASRGERRARLKDVATAILKVDRRGRGQEARRRLERESRELRAIKREQEQGKAPRQKARFVYVIAGTDGVGPVKIGIAGRLERRLAQIQTGYPHPLRIWYSREVASGRARVVEQLCHRELDRHRLNGEWFDISAAEARETIRLVLAAQEPADPAIGEPRSLIMPQASGPA